MVGEGTDVAVRTVSLKLKLKFPNVKVGFTYDVEEHCVRGVGPPVGI